MDDATLLSKGMQILIDNLGLVEAERFISLMNKEPFDYTKWQSTLFEGMTGREISAAAMKLREEKKQKEL